MRRRYTRVHYHRKTRIGKHFRARIRSRIRENIQTKFRVKRKALAGLLCEVDGGKYGDRTRDLRRDRPAL